MTAIAAVIALSSTPLLAQSADAPVVATPAPVVATPAPVVVVTPAPVAVDPIAPVADTPVAADPVVTKTTSTTPARKATTTKATAARSRPAPARVSKTTTTTTAPAAAIAAPTAAMPVEAPLPAEPIVAARPAATPIAPAPPETTADTLSGMLSSDMLPLELGGLAIVVLAGGALAIRSRRRRRAYEADEAAWQQEAEAAPEADAEPAMIVEPQSEPAYIEPAFVAAAAPALASESEPKFIAPETDLPEGFDISRFGPNVQDAYRGPTEDNPSLSLKTRLSRASGMDQQERKLDAEVEAATGEPVLDEPDPAETVVTARPAEAQAAKPAVVHHVDGDFMLGRAGKKPSLSPTYSK